ncbi:response regulator [Aromatoleum buckelii]|uniref:response regulator n=1 Tax=Aromatoleum buckelii TaxID=200254 RepID=UPI001FF5B760|nr:HD domain-containing phosphohydrolase [Aromatoleum buckelii]MCK0509614.1 response regulator [Aromatoleum buckelii]
MLIVDDVGENLTVLGALLRGAGYRVRAASTGRMALRYAAQLPSPDLVLLDVMMPEMDGYEVLRRLRETTSTRHIPVMFITARDDREDEERGLQLGAVDYVTKPMKPEVVLARVRNHLFAKHSQDQLRCERARLEAELTRQTQENEQIQAAGIRTLAYLAETRDPDTANHILRTQNYVHLLALKLSRHPSFAAMLDRPYIETLSRSAPLHDIGKLGIPDHILLKPGQLTAAERKIMQTHTKLGSDAIDRAGQGAGTPVEFLMLAREIARWHHEQWDGHGYPDGLCGHEIPLSARIMAVADVFDALISARPYKAPMPADEVREILAAARGRQFDPAVLDVFLAHFDEFVTIASRYRDND